MNALALALRNRADDMTEPELAFWLAADAPDHEAECYCRACLSWHAAVLRSVA